MRLYLDHYYEHYFTGKETSNKSDFIASTLPQLRSEVNRCLQVNNYFWAVWAMRILKEERLGDSTVFNFDFAHARVEMFEHVKKMCPV
jgi:hypothetical protein